MRTLAITQNITVDGTVEFLDHWFDPIDQDDEMVAELRWQSAGEDILLLGRRTFVQLRAFWPKQTADDTGIAAHLDQVAKYVVSSTLADPDWTNSTVLGSDWLDQVAALKHEDGGDIIVTGSISLCPALIAAALVDDYRLFVHPVVQARGRRLFPDDGDGRPLALRGSRGFPSGVVLLKYASA